MGDGELLGRFFLQGTESVFSLRICTHYVIPYIILHCSWTDQKLLCLKLWLPFLSFILFLIV